VFKGSFKTYCPPQISRPNYNRGFYVRCMTPCKDADIYPYCGTKTRKKGFRRKNGKEDKPRINFDGE